MYMGFHDPLYRKAVQKYSRKYEEFYIFLTRIFVKFYLPVEPNPPVPRSVSVNSRTSS